MATGKGKKIYADGKIYEGESNEINAGMIASCVLFFETTTDVSLMYER